MSTIYALSSAPGRGGVAVIRVSGAAALKSAKALSGRSEFEPRTAIFTRLSQNVSRETIDESILIYFKAPHSFTGEDVVEYHVHGGKAVIDALLDALSGFDDHRMAEPGEFTRRAFENGKLDLTEAEAVADLIDAQTAAQRVQALSQLGGTLSDLYAGWTEDLTEILAHLEAEIEFPDEDLPVDLAQTFHPKIKNLRQNIADHLNDNARGERLRDGIQIAVIGAPNAGKSSLVNALAQRDVAIVSDLAGTTRDVIEVHLDLGGYPVILSDTAGLRPEDLRNDGHDKIEAEGIRRALDRAQNADLKILLFDGAQDPDAATLALVDDQSICVFNKIDISNDCHPRLRAGISEKLDQIPGHPPPLRSGETEAGDDILCVSAQTGEGLDELLQMLTTKIETLYGLSETPSLTRKRHRKALEQTQGSLERSLNAGLPEMMAEDLRLSIRYLGSITGKVDVEDLLDVIFSDFCIGK